MGKSVSVGDTLPHTLIKPSLSAAYNKVLGQSTAIKMKDIPLSNDTGERRISDIAKDRETQLIEKNLKNRNCLRYNWPNLRIFRTT